jgi:MFS family permease
MHTGYYFGTLMAAVANQFIGAKYGWRAMFLLGGAPALLVAFIRYGIREPARWLHNAETGHRKSAMEAFFELFSIEYRRRTILNAIFLLVSMVGLWAGSVYVPAALTQLATAAGKNKVDAAKVASIGSTLLSVGTILGCLVVPYLAEKFGRRGALAFFYVLMTVSIAVGFGYIFYLGPNALTWFLPCLFVLGVGGASFCVFTLWLPEQYPTECRASAFAFATSSGRFVAAGATFLVGAAISRYGTLGTPVALTAIAFVIGLLLLPLGTETRGEPLYD